MADQPFSRWPWVMLFSRLGLFIGIQAIFALGFWLAGSANAWENSAAWWPLVVTSANFVTIFTLIRLFGREGKNFWDIFRIQKEHLKSDLLVLAGTLVLLGPVSYLPNIWLGSLLFGDPQQTLDLMIRPLPVIAVYASIILFPLTQGLAELANYFMYSMPRLESKGMPAWLVLSLASLMLAFQHIAVPFLFDNRYIIWRGLMFIPFAFFAGILLHWRPRLLPFLAIIHALMDLFFVTMLLGVAY